MKKIITEVVIESYKESLKADNVRYEKYKKENKLKKWYSDIDFDVEYKENTGVMYFDMGEGVFVINFKADMFFDDYIHSYENIEVTDVVYQSEEGAEVVLSVDNREVVSVVEDFIVEIDAKDNMVDHTTDRSVAEEGVKDYFSLLRNPEAYYGV